MKIYTETGDQGITSLYDGTRISKGSLRVETYGTLDELSAFIGLAKCSIEEDVIKQMLCDIQYKLFEVSAELAIVDAKKKIKKIDEEEVKMIEKNIDFCLENTTPPKSFLLPGTSFSDSYLHICRTLCRRAERMLIRLNEQETCNPMMLKYLNRLSDLFYAMGRKIAIHEEKIESK